MGVPIIGCGCAVCASDDPKNKRRRVSVFVEVDGVNLLIDTAPELRYQAIDNNITSLDGVLFTHEHGDHVNGLDDLRRFSFMQEKKPDIYADRYTLDSLQQRFSHAFGDFVPEWGWYKLRLEPHEIRHGKPFKVKDTEIKPFAQIHGKYTSIGYRIGNFVYSTDVSDFTDEVFEEYLSGLDLWVVDCQGYSDSKTHSSLEKTLQWIERAKPKQAVLTHMGHEFDYEKLRKELPKSVEPAYDNMVITL